MLRRRSSGRIDRKIEFPLPDEKTKRRIFQIHTWQTESHLCIYIYIIYIYFIIYEYFISSVIYAVDFQCFPVQRMVPFVVSQPLCFAQCYHVTGEKWPWRTMLTWRSLSLPRSLPANTLCCSLRLKRLASFRQMEIAGWSKWCWYQGTLCLLDGCMKLVLRSTPELWTRWRRFAPKQECLRSASDEWRWRRLYHRSCRTAETAETAETTDYLLLCYMKSISTAGSMMPVNDAWDAAFVQADMRKAKEKALYKKKGSYPEGMYL